MVDNTRHQSTDNNCLRLLLNIPRFVQCTEVVRRWERIGANVSTEFFCVSRLLLKKQKKSKFSNFFFFFIFETFRFLAYWFSNFFFLSLEHSFKKIVFEVCTLQFDTFFDFLNCFRKGNYRKNIR